MADGGQAATTAVNAEVVHVRVHEEGGEQFIVLPEAFRFQTAEVTLHVEDGRLILAPAAPEPPPETSAEWARFWSRIDALRGDGRATLADDDDAPDRGP